MGNLNGRRALVTGGTRGLGQAISHRLEKEGATVIITGTSIPQSENAFSVDFTDLIATRAFAGIVADLKVDILVNNAGITAVGDFADIQESAFDAVEQVNVKAPFLLCQAALPYMVQSRWGRIVNIGSIFGIIGRDKRSPYCVSKFALDGMTAALSAEVAQYGVLVNTVCPGFIDTDLTRSVLKPHEIDELTSKVPARRLGLPAEVASLVAWLSSPENSFISGQQIAIDGGYTRV